MNDKPNYERRAARACFAFGLKPRDAQPAPKPRRQRTTRTWEDRNARIIDGGYEAYAREEGHYDEGGDR